jgi:hypothetical protein
VRAGVVPFLLITSFYPRLCPIYSEDEIGVKRRKNCLFFLTGLKMVVGVGFCKIKVDSNFLLVLKIKCTTFHQDWSKTVDLHTKYTNRHAVLYTYIYFSGNYSPTKSWSGHLICTPPLCLDRHLIVLTGMENFHLNAHNFLLSPAFI